MARGQNGGLEWRPFYRLRSFSYLYKWILDFTKTQEINCTPNIILRCRKWWNPYKWYNKRGIYPCNAFRHEMFRHRRIWEERLSDEILMNFAKFDQTELERTLVRWIRRKKSEMFWIYLATVDLTLRIMNFSLQYMTEKMGGAEGTKLDVDFVDMERVSDVFLCAPK